MTTMPISAGNRDSVGETGAVFRCLACRNEGLTLGTNCYTCPRCGASYPVVLGVPLLIKEVQVRPSGFRLPVEAVAAICDYMQTPRTEVEAQFLQEVFSRRYDFGDFHLDAENNYFFNRFRVLQELFRKPPRIDGPTNVDVRFTIEHHLVGATLPCGQVQTRNVRLRNTGSSVISSTGPRAVALSYHWRNSTGVLVESAEERTALPIDLPPGRAISVPTLLRMPVEPGAYLLELTLFQKGVGWLDRDSRLIGVQVLPPSWRGTRREWRRTRLPAETYDYAKDHEAATDLLRHEVERSANGKRLRILEVGGCCAPMIHGLPHELYNVDIDVQTLQIGAFRLRRESAPIRYVAADANDLPFAGESFDCIALFATLHHFPNPGQLLAGLKRLLVPDGFLALMCEPVGSYLNGVIDDRLRDELLQGINEQVFTEEEYEEMFLQHGLVASRVEIDRGSLKAILRKRYPANTGSCRQRRRPFRAPLAVGWRACRSCIRLIKKFGPRALASIRSKAKIGQGA